MARKPKDLFLEALDQPAELQRDWIISQCGDDIELRDRALGLLDAHHQAHVLDRGAATIGSSWLAPDVPPKPREASAGDIIDRYELVMPLGEGGFGSVFLARQREPVVREVALKILRSGLNSKQIVARFEAEQQALAIMDHPNIARVYDAGTTEAGRPFIAMEYVDGPPITQYCDQHRLSLEDRFRLTEQVCLAIQHAHQKGIIHRDVKPSNILIAEIDGKPVPKIIDFGIAKVMDETSPALTQEMQIVGTPQYMSPEQATMGAKGIDTRSDIYSLGTVLYELISGAPPFDPQQLQHAALDQILKIIRDDTPAKPSTRIVSDPILSKTVTTTYGTNSTRLARLIAGEVDWIVMKALEKEPGRRYQSASDLAADIRRYLAHEPVQAGPPSSLYQLRKFVRRHRVEVTAASVVALMLVATTVISLIMASRARKAEAVAVTKQREAEHQLAKSDAIANFTDELLSGIGPGVAKGRDTTLLREILDHAAKASPEKLKDQPIIDLTIRGMIANVMYDLGDVEPALNFLKPIYDATKNAPDADQSERYFLSAEVATLLEELNRFDEALEVTQEALDGYKRLGMGNSTQYADTLAALASIHLRKGDYPAAQKAAEESVAISKSLGKLDRPNSLNAQNNLANAYFRLNRSADATAMWEGILETQKKTLGDEHPDTLGTRLNLAIVYKMSNQFDKSEQTLREVLKIQQKIHEAGAPDMIKTLNLLGELLKTRGRIEDAAATLEEALRQCSIKLPPEHEIAQAVKLHLAEVRAEQKRFDDAIALNTEVYGVYSQLYGADDRRSCEVLQQWIDACVDAGQIDNAIALLKAHEPKEWNKNVTVFYRGIFEISAGRAMLAAGRLGEAKSRASKGRELLQSRNPSKPVTYSALLALEKAISAAEKAPAK